MEPILRHLLHYLNPVESLRHHQQLRRTIELAKRTYRISAQDLNPLALIFTCDTELTPPFKGGTWYERESTVLEKELPVLLGELENLQIHGTFYVEGILCKKFPDFVASLLKEGHEIGCHGYTHESYGGYWRTAECVAQPTVLSPYQRKARIQLATSLIKRITGRSPTSFKAPFDVIDECTLSILQGLGFEVDSSFYNFAYNKFSVPYHPDAKKIDRVGDMKIFELPFTVSPFPRRKWLYSCKFDPISTVYASNVERALKIVNLLRQAQTILGYPVSVIFITSHPWEFSNETASGKTQTFGKKRLKALSSFFEGILSAKNMKNYTVRDFIRYWRAIEPPRSLV